MKKSESEKAEQNTTGRLRLRRSSKNKDAKADKKKKLDSSSTIDQSQNDSISNSLGFDTYNSGVSSQVLGEQNGLAGLDGVAYQDVDASAFSQMPFAAPAQYDADKYIGGDISFNDIQRANDIANRISTIFKQRVIGQDRMRVALVAALIAKGHILIESVPGLAKTTAVRALASSIGSSFSRIQCTPDLMPNDIVGTQVYNYNDGKFNTQLGPVHSNLVLLDEINRSSAKTQSAMLEAMQERQTSIGGVTYDLPNPFMVLATQNPIEEEGTYVLPEAQMDRFLLKEIITYPNSLEEVEIVDSFLTGKFEEPLQTEPATIEDVLFMQDLCKRVFLSPAIKHYIVSIVATTRGGGPNPIVGLNKVVRVGASPRATLAFIRVCQALAMLQGRSYVIPEDVKEMRYSVLRHRIVRTFDAMADDMPVEQIIDQVFQVVPVP